MKKNSFLGAITNPAQYQNIDIKLPKKIKTLAKFGNLFNSFP